MATNTNSTANDDEEDQFPTGFIPTRRSTCLSGIQTLTRSRGGRTSRSAVTLLVRFRWSGREYVYSGVPFYYVSDLLTALSIGRYYNNAIKGQFPSRQA